MSFSKAYGNYQYGMWKVDNLTIKKEQGTDRTVYAQWAFKNDTTSDRVGAIYNVLDKFSYKWIYKTKNGTKFVGSEGTVNKTAYTGGESRIFRITYTPPENAFSVFIYVWPESTKDSNNNNVEYFKGDTSVLASYNVVKLLTLETPTLSRVEVDPDDLTGNRMIIEMRISENDLYTNFINIEIYDTSILSINRNSVSGDFKGAGSFVYKDVNSGASQTAYIKRTGGKPANGGIVIERFNMINGHSYIVRCQAIYSELTTTKNNKTYYKDIDACSDWSDYSEEIIPKPDKPDINKNLNIKTIEDDPKTKEFRFKLTILGDGSSESPMPGATSHEIQYLFNSKEFDVSTQSPQSITLDNKATVATINVTEGGKYYFRMRAINAAGESYWSDISNGSVTGRRPSPPTTWSNVTTAKIYSDDDVKLYWVHNSADNSDEVSAKVHIRNSRVPTLGYTHVVSASSRKPNETAYLDLKKLFSITDSTINALKPTDGDTIYWKVQTRGSYSSSSIDDTYSDYSIERSIRYWLMPTVTVMAPSRVTVFPINVSIVGGSTNQKMIAYNLSIYSASQTYEVMDPFTRTRKVIPSGALLYSVTESINAIEHTHTLVAGISYDFVNFRNYRIAVTATFESGLTASNECSFMLDIAPNDYDLSDTDVTFLENTMTAQIDISCKDRNGNGVTSGVSIDVYRINYDGSFSLVEKGAKDIHKIIDPHPNLKTARYRIIAINDKNGSIDINDLDAISVNIPEIVINWDEEWFTYEEDTSALTYVDPQWTGSMLRLPYNIDISEDRDFDVSLNEYIGRKNPVSYYGTQVREKGTWKVDIPKSDAETLFQLRRLSVWPGDVYVREPSGLGYWANVKVKMNINHCDLVVPVTINVTKVEGGS